MINLETLDLVIGLATVFLTVALVCSSINELLAAILNTRANTLIKSLQDLLGSTIAQQVIDHPVVPSAQSKNGEKQPAYIEPALFASALLDVIAPAKQGSAETSFAQVTTAIAGLVDGTPLQRTLQAFAQKANGDYDKLHDQVAAWFDAYMDRVTGVYKRRSHQIATVIAVFVVVILNIDTFDVYRGLVTQPAFQAAISQRANVLIHQPSVTSSNANSGIGGAVNAVSASITTLPVPIGWHLPQDWSNPFQKIIGLLITIVAASFGAPFWFGVLTNLTNIRSAGQKPADPQSDGQ